MKQLTFYIRRVIGLLGILLVTVVTGFADDSISVTDFTGRTVVLDQPAKRIVAMAPHIVENLFTAGAGPFIVGAVDYSDYPESAKVIPRLGVAHGASIEGILDLQPDLVIGWASGHSTQRYKKLRALGIPVYLDEPKTLEDIAKSIRDFGRLTGQQTIANAAANDYLLDLQQLQQSYTGREAVTVLYQVWNQPLRTVNRYSIISDVIALCGGRNIFADAATIAPKISIESVLERNPRVIVASGTNNQRPPWLDEWKRWPSLAAVKHNNLLFIPPDLLQRHTVRLLQGGRLLCEQLDAVRAGR